ncbi:MAG: phospholipase D-like domain-containing protein [Parachlamydiales bacterium]|jgi:phosphatidylserine/phosphatidylglycerophosphate/cardiolipin synthase-like enzyme
MPKKKSLKSLRKPKKITLKQAICLFPILLIAYLLSSYDDLLHPLTFPNDGEPVAIYSSDTHHDIKKLYRDAIDSAEKNIFLYIYSFTDPVIAAKLKEKTEQGIKVTLICDKDGAAKTKKLVGKKVQVISRQNEGFMHLKIMVIDEQKVLIGSANLTTESLVMHHNNVCVFNSPNLAMHLISLSEHLNRSNNQTGADFPERKFTIGNQPIEFWMLPGNTAACKKLVKLIDNAKESIQVAMFTFTRYDMVYALLRAKRRGVDVRIILDAGMSKGAGHHIATLLFLQRVPLKISQGSPLLHHKFMVIDESTFVTGSANWTKNAFNNNDDCFLIIENLTPPQSGRLKELWDNLDRSCGIFTCDEVDAA